MWDEAAKEWRPRWGYRRANDKTKDWCIEVPDQAGKHNGTVAEGWMWIGWSHTIIECALRARHPICMICNHLHHVVIASEYIIIY